MLPISYTKNIETNLNFTACNSELKDMLYKSLIQSKAYAIHVGEHEIRFKAGPFRCVSSLNPLVGISFGRLLLREEEGRINIEYTLNFYQTLLFFGGVSVLIVATQIKNNPSIILGTLVFYAISLASIPITILTFDKFISRVIGPRYLR